jgi:hypothetical protein
MRLWLAIQPPIQGRSSWPASEGQQQLDYDVADGAGLEAVPLRGQEQRRQQRRDHDADEVGGRGRAERGGNIAAGDRGEGDRRLHGGWQHGEEQQPRRDRSIDEGQVAETQAEQREQHEGHRQHREVQLPVAQAVPDRLTRQLGAVEEEQQHDSDLHHPADDRRRLAAHRQDRGQNHHAEQQQDVGVDLQLGEEVFEHGITAIWLFPSSAHPGESRDPAESSCRCCRKTAASPT